tara:strand:+ start:3601 stop:4014 length:414 start_codon:yes stop_codon:yes gene_type:complete
MDTPPEKHGPEYDAIRKDLLICHQNRAWQVIQYSITIQTAFIAGWYYALFEANRPSLALGATIFSFSIMFLLMQALQRYNFLMGKASAALNGASIYLNDKEGSAPRGAATSQRIMVVILIANTVLFGFTLGIGFGPV